ncbi:protein BatD [Vibrio sinensis]|uniref:Protein BatD n=1 Tax=Vibrio sinensis TaxID=2302434 RepID=A0A3A6QZ25_9VIBR|nr:protein BatD [Vibrio sinensis]
MNLYSVLTLTLALISPAVMATTILASVSKNKVAKNEVFQLRIVADEKASSDDIDFSVLQKDFYLGRPSFGSSINIINGDRSVRSEWNISLAAQSLGQVTIPAFKLNGASSQPISIQVTADKNQPKSDDLVQVYNELSRTNLYPNESAYLKTRLIIKADPRRLQDPKVIPPHVEGISIAQQGEPKQYQSVLDGMEVTVLDQTYLITADAPGNYTLTGSAFKGSVVYADNQTGVTSLIPVNTTPEKFTITVNKKPEDYQGAWLPTDKLTLTQEWRDSSGHIVETKSLKTKVGDSLTRELSLEINGLNAERYPNITINYPDSVRVYAEKPQFTQLENGNTLMKVKQVLIPQKEGTFELNSVKLNWWNSKLKKQQSSQLTGLTIEVGPGDVINAPSNIAPPAPTETVVVKDAGYWPYLTGGFALLWVLTLIYAVRKPNVNQASTPTSNTKLSSHAQQLHQAITHGDIIQTQYCAAQWLRNRQISEEMRTEIESELNKMQENHYSIKESEWSSTKLLKLIKKADRISRSKMSDTPTLPKL